MLVLTRKRGEQLVIDGDVVVQVLSISGRRVRLGVQAPAGTRVVRRELAMLTGPVGATAREPSPPFTGGSTPQRRDGPASGLPRGETALADRPRPADPSHVVLAEDDDEMRALLSQALRAEGYEVSECRDGLQLVGLLWDDTHERFRRDFDLVITDIRMPGVLGLSVLAGVQDCGGGLPVILITAFGDEATHAEAQRLGAAAILDKPFEVDELLVTVRNLLP
jgi:carbon storage regulator CsrA